MRLYGDMKRISMLYLYVTLSKSSSNANRQSVGEGRETKEENNDTGLTEAERRGALELHRLCCSAKEMHSHALFSNACLGVVHKRAWLT